MVFEKIIILYNSRIPTEKANGYQTFKTAESFIYDNKHVEIWGPKRFNIKPLRSREVKEYYNLIKTPKIIKIFVIDLLGIIKFENFLTKYCKLFANILLMGTFAIGLVLRILKTQNKNTIYFTRDVNLASFLIFFHPNLKDKIFIELHNLPSIPKRRIRQFNILKKVKGVIALTNTMRSELIENKISKDKILYSPDAVDTSQFKIPQTKKEARFFLSIPLKLKVFLYLGKFHTLGNEKGIPEIIESIKFLNFEEPYKFYIVGGPLDRLQKYNRLIEENNIDKNKIVFLGRQEIKDIPMWLKAADILLMPHPKTIFYERYVSPLKLFEYMCSNNPIIASNLDSIKEILSHKKNGYLVEPGSSLEIANAIYDLVKNPSLSLNIAAEAYKDVDDFSWAKRGLRINRFIAKSLLT